MWTEIKEQAGIDDLMRKFGYFHDTCIRDIYISTEEFVDEKRSMSFNNVLTVSLLFQRQSRENSVLELKFEAVKKMDYEWLFEYGSTLIDTGATLKIEDNLFYWADDLNWTVGNNDAWWINGERLFWRFRPELLGNVKRINDD